VFTYKDTSSIDYTTERFSEKTTTGLTDVSGNKGVLEYSAAIFVKQNELWLIPFAGRPFLKIGIHAKDSATGDVIGATIPNDYTGSGSYGYKISAITENEFIAGSDSTLGRSLKDCGSDYFWDTQWNGRVQWPDDLALSEDTLYGNGSSTFVNLGALSQDISATTPVVAGNGQPIGRKMPSYTPNTVASAPLHQFVFGSISGGGLGSSATDNMLYVTVARNQYVPPGSYGGQFQHFRSLGGPACDGCQTRYKVFGYMNRSYLVKRTSPYSNGSILFIDTLYFDGLSECFSSGSGNSFTVYPDARTITGIHWVGGYSYGFFPQLIGTSNYGSNFVGTGGCFVSINT
jgi:hypothetical protein